MSRRAAGAAGRGQEGTQLHSTDPKAAERRQSAGTCADARLLELEPLPDAATVGAKRTEIWAELQVIRKQNRLYFQPGHGPGSGRRRLCLPIRRDVRCRVWRPKLTIFLPPSEPLCPAGSHSPPPLSLGQPSPSGRASSLGSQNVPRKDKGLPETEQGSGGRGGGCFWGRAQPASSPILTTVWLAPLGKGPQAAALQPPTPTSMNPFLTGWHYCMGGPWVFLCPSVGNKTAIST